MIVKIIKGVDPYTRIVNSTIKDPSLSFRALGILTYLLSKPPNWVMKVEDLQARQKEGRDAIRAAMNELQKSGYAKLMVFPGKGSEWHVFETPEGLKSRLPEALEIRQPENPAAQKPVPLITTELIRKEVIIPESLNNAPFLEVFEDYKLYRREKKQPLGPVAAKRLLNTLTKRPNEAILALERAMTRNWQGFDWSWYDSSNGQQNKPKRPVENAI